MLPNIHLLGIQGSGKGTQAAILEQHFNLTLIASGSLFRDRAAIDDVEGRRVASFLNRGELLPDEDLLAVVEEKLTNSPDIQGILGDGVLRTVKEYELLLPVWARHDIDQPLVCLLELSDEIARQRIQERHATAQERREDATDHAIARRIHLFHEQTKAVVHHAAEIRRLVTIDAAQDKDLVTKDLMSAIQPYIHELT